MAGWDSYINDKLVALGYTHKEDAKRSISAVMNMFGDFHPEETGSVNKVLCAILPILALSGTIPISFKGRSYHIPIMIQLLPDFPYEAPQVFVKPTSSRFIAPSRYVDGTGRVSLPELRDWVNGCDHSVKVTRLMKKLRMVFGQSPPVYTCKSLQRVATTSTVTVVTKGTQIKSCS